MELTMLKAKNVVLGVKKGMTLEDFCNKYQCTSEELQERIRQVYGHNKKQLKTFFVQIAANEKKPRKELETDVLAIDADKTDESITEEQTPEVTLRRTELASLADLEEQQSKRVMALESEHKELAAEHRTLKTSLRELSDNIDKLMSEFQRYHQSFEEILSRNSEVEARMNEISTEWNTERAALADTRERIDELSSVTLCVYASGEITPMEGCEFVPDDTDWQSTRDALLEKDQCQELRLKDIGTLARLLMIVKHADCKIEVICDNSDLEIAFQELRD